MAKMERGRGSIVQGEAETELNRVMVDFIASRQWRLARRSQLWSPPTDVYETDRCIVVKVEIAGMRKEDFRVVLSGHTLTISGARGDPAAKLGYHQMEIRYGGFAARVRIPGPVAREGIEATYDNGFLTVILPKGEG